MGMSYVSVEDTGSYQCMIGKVEDGEFIKDTRTISVDVATNEEYLPPSCGYDLSQKTVGTVRNGNETNPHQYPWMVYVCASYEEENEFDSDGQIIDVKIKCGEACGGTMIASKFILTAAHCVANATTDNTLVLLGAHSIAKSMSKLDYVFLQNILIHSCYDCDRKDELKQSPDI